MQRKGQAAMEFLMTYGWAILAAAIAIVVLAYFGVFSPEKYVSNVCTVNAPFDCEEYSITSGGVIQLTIRNGGGNVIDVTSIVIDGCEDGAGGNLLLGPYVDVADGGLINEAVASGVLTFGCDPVLTGKFKGDITMIYRTDDGSIDQTASGSISGRVP
tara:strand:+ start:316 stop:789 length:474 start_codon:yes stop_codon:yes gene_type:complete